jgi:hypothetical protein
MADQYVPVGSTPNGFADISSFVADANAINAATKTALNLALTNISNLFAPVGSASSGAAHPDFNKIPPATRQKIQNEITVLQNAVTAHA